MYRGRGRRRRRAAGGTFFTSGYKSADDVADRDYIIFTTDGVATIIANGTDGPPAHGRVHGLDHNPVTAYFEKGTSVVYTSQDVSCYSGTMHGVQSYPWAGGASSEAALRRRRWHDTLNTCLEKGDFVFLFSNKITTMGQGDAGPRRLKMSVGNMYEIVKIGVNPTSSSTYAVEDRFYFVVDKVINYDGSEVAARALVATAAAGTAAVSSVIDADYTDDDLRETPSEQMIGLQSIVKFAPASTGTYSTYLDNNKIEGPLPTEIGQLTGLTQLRVPPASPTPVAARDRPSASQKGACRFKKACAYKISHGKCKKASKCRVKKFAGAEKFDAHGQKMWLCEHREN
ncbi:hypothetical protein JL721_10313 [Aureococcus anophagefferens]|nr:hypothetical protein JL721_10313 [Aureococcus anophagefferens]